jgi:hypothetical protein
LAVDLALVSGLSSPEQLDHAAERRDELRDLGGAQVCRTRRAAGIEPNRDRGAAALDLIAYSFGKRQR